MSILGKEILEHVKNLHLLVILFLFYIYYGLKVSLKGTSVL